MNFANNALGVQIGPMNAPLNVPRELGLIERAGGLSSGLRLLHTKLSDLRDRIDGSGSAGMGTEGPIACGLPSQLSDAEQALRACHSLLDDIAGKF